MAEDWVFSSSQHARAATKNVDDYLKKKGLSFPKSCDSPLSILCRPELSATSELSIEDAAHFQSLIGVLRWIVELGRVGVCLEASIMRVV